MSIYRAIHCRNCPHTIVWYAIPRSWPKVFSGPVDKHNLWTRPRPFSAKYKSDYCFSIRTVQRSLYQEGYNRRVVKKKVRIREVNRKKHVKWAREKLHCRIEGQWDRVIFSDESQVVVGNNNQIYIWRKKDESRDCACPPAQRKL
jgi:hypothetical protein